MNEQHGNHSEQRIRQTLNTLPDAPPPGSAFDSAALWERLRPELSAQSVAAQSAPTPTHSGRKRSVFGWWLAAASAVMLLGWFWWAGQATLKPDAVIRKSAEKAGVNIDLLAKLNPPVSQPNVVIPPIDTRLATAFQKQQRPRTNQTVTGPVLTKQPGELVINQASTADTGPAVSPVDAVSVPPESTSLTPAVTQKPAIARALKRRFRVVHANELAAEEEQTHLTQSRADHFVRLGTGSPASAGSGGGSEPPTLQVSLSRKSIQ